MTSINKIQDIQDTVTERKRMDKVLLKTKVHGKRKWQKRQAERVFLEEQKRQGINKVFYEASSVYKLQQSLDLLHQKSLVLRNESIVGASKVIATVESVIQKSRLVNFSHEKEQREMRQGAFLLEVASTGGNQGGKQRKSKDLKVFDIIT